MLESMLFGHLQICFSLSFSRSSCSHSLFLHRPSVRRLPLPHHHALLLFLLPALFLVSVPTSLQPTSHLLSFLPVSRPAPMSGLPAMTCFSVSSPIAAFPPPVSESSSRRSRGVGSLCGTALSDPRYPLGRPRVRVRVSHLLRLLLHGHC